jgi:hypothetical protein
VELFSKLAAIGAALEKAPQVGAGALAGKLDDSHWLKKLLHIFETNPVVDGDDHGSVRRFGFEDEARRGVAEVHHRTIQCRGLGAQRKDGNRWRRRAQGGRRRPTGNWKPRSTRTALPKEMSRVPVSPRRRASRRQGLVIASIGRRSAVCQHSAWSMSQSTRCRSESTGRERRQMARWRRLAGQTQKPHRRARGSRFLRGDLAATA